MNKKIKQVLVAALALVMCAGALLYDPLPAFAKTYSHSLTFKSYKSELTYLDMVENESDVLPVSIVYKNGSNKVCTLAYFSLGPFGLNTSGHYLDYTASRDGEQIISSSMDCIGSLVAYSSKIYYVYARYITPDSNDFDAFVNSSTCVVKSLESTNVGTYIDMAGEFETYFTGDVANAIYDALNGKKNDDVQWNDSTSVYENAVDELGYIQNITTATKNVNLMHANQHSIPVIKFSFSTTTSTGKKIYEEGMDVQYMLTARSFESESDYSQKNVYKSAKSDLFFVSKNPNIYDEENSLNKGFFNFSAASDTWQSMHSELKDGMSFFANMVYDREFFIRPIYKESIFAPIKYGGWSRVVIDALGKTHVIEGTVEGGENNPDATPDSDGQLDDANNQYDSDHKVGSGDNESDAESNSKDASDISVSDFVDSFKDFDLSSLGNILNQLGEAASAFADLLGVVFGWMPTWVRGSLIAAVCIWIFMLIKRAIF